MSLAKCACIDTLYTELPWLERFQAAKNDGFEAVEFWDWRIRNLEENGSRITDFVYQTHRIYDGKPALAGLPATYTEDSKEAQTLEIELKDELIHTTLILYYTIFEELPAITRSAKVIYHGTEKIVLKLKWWSLFRKYPQKK